MSNRINQMFGRIADDYDTANTALSFGIHRLWRTSAVRAADVQPGDRILDGATGTGDLAFKLAHATGPSGEVIGLDFNDNMLEVARDKHRERQRHDASQIAPIDWQLADLQSLPYDDDSFDRATVGFGIRNVDDPVQAIRELHRVLRPGGRLIILEFGQPDGLFGALFDWYSRHIIPRLGGLVAGDREAYDYLHNSSSHFPCGGDFLEILQTSADFDTTRWRELTGGIAYLYAADLQSTRNRSD